TSGSPNACARSSFLVLLLVVLIHVVFVLDVVVAGLRRTLLVALLLLARAGLLVALSRIAAHRLLLLRHGSSPLRKKDSNRHRADAAERARCAPRRRSGPCAGRRRTSCRAVETKTSEGRAGRAVRRCARRTRSRPRAAASKRG